MLDVFVRKSLTSRALRQPHISSSSSPSRFILCASRRASLNAVLSGFGRGFGGCTPLVATMENVVELGNGITAFYADGHAKSLYMMRDPCAYRSSRGFKWGLKRVVLWMMMMVQARCTSTFLRSESQYTGFTAAIRGLRQLTLWGWAAEHSLACMANEKEHENSVISWKAA